MAQGSLKVKAKKPTTKKNSKGSNSAATKGSASIRKGHRTFKPKKVKAQEVHKLQKAIKNKINANIESELAQRAHRCEEGKAFNYINVPGSSSSGKKGKKNSSKK